MKVLKMLGNGRLEARCFDGNTRLCHIRGKLRKKVWINQSDIILIGLRDYQDAKADVIMKYNAEEARNLKLYGELPDSSKKFKHIYFLLLYNKKIKSFLCASSVTVFYSSLTV